MWMIDDQQLNDRPLMTTIPTSCFHKNPNILLPWTHSISGGGGGASDYGVKNSTRWNPTPEQLQALEEMYRRGTRTPSAEQIQHIAAKLRRFGNIQGKNVFYWFQNHKARERHKIRRQLPPQRPKQTGLSGRYFEFEHQIKLPTPSEASVSMHGAVVAEYKKDERTGLDQKKNETSCWRLDLSSSCLPPNNSVQTFTSGQENSKPCGYGALNLSILLPPKNDDSLETLQLFPFKSNDLSSFDIAAKKEDILGVSRSGTKFTPNEFIEFL